MDRWINLAALVGTPAPLAFNTALPAARTLHLAVWGAVTPTVNRPTVLACCRCVRALIFGGPSRLLGLLRLFTVINNGELV
ncbi:hypothetical protein DL93DRAFT_2080657 [Clavulina sp. PMI_390]|nr:hypothetical protein DL93DRAFT_2080657 [Clavulina sp. PMI_390]